MFGLVPVARLIEAVMTRFEHSTTGREKHSSTDFPAYRNHSAISFCNNQKPLRLVLSTRFV